MIENLEPLDQVNLELVTAYLKPTCTLSIRRHRESFEDIITTAGLEFHAEQNRIKTHYAIAHDQQALQTYLNAKTRYERGLALGYPEDACEKFQNEKNSHWYLRDQITLAIRNGYPLPTWLAYISHIPSELNIMTAKIAQSSERQGSSYQTHIRKNKPSLGRLIEEQFLKRWCQEPPVRAAAQHRWHDE